MNYLAHYGVKGQTWGHRRFQNEDGSYTQAGLGRYYKGFKRNSIGDPNENLNRDSDKLPMYRNETLNRGSDRDLKRSPNKLNTKKQQVTDSILSMPVSKVTNFTNNGSVWI